MTKPTARTTPESRAELYRRWKAGEKQSALVQETGLSRQLVSQIIARSRKLETLGPPGTPVPRQRRNLDMLIPDKLEALRQLITTQTPAGAGLPGFHRWHYRAVVKLMQKHLSFRLMGFEAHDLLIRWGIQPAPPAQAADGGPPRFRPSRFQPEEVFEQDYYDYINSDIGKQVLARSREAEAREQREREARIASGWKKPGRGRPPGKAKAPAAPAHATPHPAGDGEFSDALPSLEEMERRLGEMRVQLGDEAVDSVLDHYSSPGSPPAPPKKRGSNFTPPKKKRRKR